MPEIFVRPADFRPGDVFLDRAPTAGVVVGPGRLRPTAVRLVTFRQQVVRLARRSSWDADDRTHVRFRRQLGGGRLGRESSQFLRTDRAYPIERAS